MEVKLPDHLLQALRHLNEPARPDNLVNEDTLRELASRRLIHYNPDSGAVVYTEAGKQLYLELTGFWPTRNV